MESSEFIDIQRAVYKEIRRATLRIQPAQSDITSTANRQAPPNADG